LLLLSQLSFSLERVPQAELELTIRCIGSSLAVDPAEGVFRAAEARRVTWHASLRYQHQGFELNVPWIFRDSTEEAAAATVAAFHRLHERLYTFAQEDTPVEIVTLRVDARGVFPVPALRELPTGVTLGAILGVIGMVRIALWQNLGVFDYGEHWVLVAFTVGAALVGIVTFGSLAGSMLPFILMRIGFDPASASAPFIATLVDVTGLVIYFSIALVFLRGTLL